MAEHKGITDLIEENAMLRRQLRERDVRDRENTEDRGTAPMGMCSRRPTAREHLTNLQDHYTEMAARIGYLLRALPAELSENADQALCFLITNQK